jgi:DNA-binding MarR family transcriptional regulator
MKLVNTIESFVRALTAVNELLKEKGQAQMSCIDLISLVLLRQHGQDGIGKIGKMRGVSTAAITGNIDSLEEKLLVTRTTPKEDRRKVLVSFSPLGEEGLTAASAALDEE